MKVGGAGPSVPGNWEGFPNNEADYLWQVVWSHSDEWSLLYLKETQGSEEILE